MPVIGGISGQELGEDQGLLGIPGHLTAPLVDQPAGGQGFPLPRGEGLHQGLPPEERLIGVYHAVVPAAVIVPVADVTALGFLRVAGIVVDREAVVLLQDAPDAGPAGRRPSSRTRPSCATRQPLGLVGQAVQGQAGMVLGLAHQGAVLRPGVDDLRRLLHERPLEDHEQAGGVAPSPARPGRAARYGTGDS